MEGQQRSKRSRVYSVEPNALTCANFSQKYISYLLPALLNVTTINGSSSSGRNKDNKIKKKTIRFQVDMALVLSTGEFRWSHALRRKLEQGMDPRKIHNTTATFEPTTIGTFNIETLGQLLAWPGIPRPVDEVKTQMDLKPNSKLNEAGRLRTIGRRQGAQGKEIRREEEIDDHIKLLRMLLPGGNEMGLSELLSEVESYVVCLRLQVDILNSLVGPC
ncbi:transcription factor bHLH146 [Cocos nucifera]|uniref:Transcription factor bHLH146 n=1 Tax=Cocos nucifera TaxID=13894 RepID=A0A8K0HUM4_COCNU|nr:transcription factor bHLH146 [Cocos nucifera]